MTGKDTGGSAFPLRVPTATQNGTVISADIHPGMTLRDYFAGQAMESMALGMMQSGYEEKLSPSVIYAGIAKASYSLADAMLAARVQP